MKNPTYLRGTILIVTMLALAAMASITLVLCRSARVDALASANVAASLQASSIERGAERYVLALLEAEQEAVLDVGEDEFAAVPIGTGYFWVIRPDYGDTSLPVYGLVDEASKLNINTAEEASLNKLPDMSTDIAAAIVDWRDADSNTRAGGAENEYYLSLADPYFCKNGPFESVEELLLVRGVTRELLYGNPAVQAASTGAFDARLTDQQAGQGWSDLLTRYSYEPAASGAGGQPVNVNVMSQRNRLRDVLRQRLGDARGNQVFAAVGPANLRDIFDFYFRTGLKIDELELIEGDITTTAQPQLRGRINLNTATRDVLLCLPGLESADVDRLISDRPGAGDASIAWVAQALDRKAIGLGPLITGRSYQYSADIVAASGDGRAFKRCRIIVDMAGGTPQIIYRRDLTERGWPMDPELLASLRAGRGPGTLTHPGGTNGGGLTR